MSGVIVTQGPSFTVKYNISFFAGSWVDTISTASETGVAGAVYVSVANLSVGGTKGPVWSCITAVPPPGVGLPTVPVDAEFLNRRVISVLSPLVI